MENKSSLRLFCPSKLHPITPDDANYQSGSVVIRNAKKTNAKVLLDSDLIHRG